MQKASSLILLSPTDLSNFLGCKHATWLDLQVARGLAPKPKYYNDPTLETLIAKGKEFEEKYIGSLEADGKRVIRLTGTRKADTLLAMRHGYDVIYQAPLDLGDWQGRADFLVKRNKPSTLGDWSYEVEDTKFAKNTKSGAVLQICLYSWMLADLQGAMPEHMYIKTPEDREQYRVDDYLAFLRLMQKRISNAIVHTSETTYPHPVEHCEICRWWVLCNDRRRKDDHPGFIAGMGSAQIREVKNWNVNTLSDMANVPLPILHQPTHGNINTYTRLREQARVQLEAREQHKNIYELLDLITGTGLYKLPEPCEGDMFFDFEGDPFVGTMGREYLFGWVYQHEYHAVWALDDAGEKKAFEDFIDLVMKIWHAHPGMHIYHYAVYESAAIKRLMGKYATREDEVDRLLRAEIFIDLHTITRQTLRAGVETYSLKMLERFHNFQRKQELEELRGYKILFENLLETGNVEAIDETTMNIVKDYNMDDCYSAESLRNWLEELRDDLIRKGNQVDRPPIGRGDAGETVTAHQQRIRPIFEALTYGMDVGKKITGDEAKAKWILAHMLDWYRREKKAYWWNYFRLRDLTDEELISERDAIAGLTFTGNISKVKKSEVHYYSFFEQETDIRSKDAVAYKDQDVGELVSIDFKSLIVGIKKPEKAKNIHPTHIILKDEIKDTHKENSIISLAEWVVANGITAEGEHQAARDLLLRRFTENITPIQGPPGTGKSHTAAKMILQYVGEGKKIGVTALSHKVITELLNKVIKAAPEQSVQIVQKVSDANVAADWLATEKYEKVIDAIKKGVNIVAGTSFMWSRPEFNQTVDVLFVDEAGQLSLIDTLAIAQAAKKLVLLGDPQQLQQPQKGSHPEGTEVSALAHILGNEQTIHENHGRFLNETWRMHPHICSYVSELFYENRLTTHFDNVNQRIEGDTQYDKPGIYVHSLEHFGNSNSSKEEVEKVQQIVNDLLTKQVYFNSRDNQKIRVGADCIKIITPYNAQVKALSDALPAIAIGTVDKFQGQEAPVIIFSMATSSPQDAPRGMEFLYSLNRLNVAVSRARAVFILVASPLLFEPDCRTPHHMKLANALCRLLEVSHS